MYNDRILRLTIRSNEFDNSFISFYIKGYDDSSLESRKTVTSYPTMQGTPISDHAFKELRTVTLNLKFSRYSKALNMWRDVNGERIYVSMEEAIELFNTWLDNTATIEYQSRLETIQNMVITSISNIEDNSSKGIWQPTITLQELRIAELVTGRVSIEYPASTGERVSSSNELLDLGEQNGVSFWDNVDDSIEWLNSKTKRVYEKAKKAVVEHSVTQTVVSAVGTASNVVKNAGRKAGRWVKGLFK